MDTATPRDNGLSVENRAAPLPKGDALDEIAQRLIARGGPKLIRVSEPGKVVKSPKTVYYVARHAIVERILSDPENFSLSHYDDLLQSVGGDLRFFLGENSPDQALRRRILAAAQSRPPQKGSSPVDAIANTAREISQTVLNALLLQRGSQGQFDIVRNYGYFVPYLTAVKTFGVRGPDRAPLLVRLLGLVRNHQVKGERLYFGSEITPSHTLLAWFHLIFGHVFRNFENREKPLLFLSKWASRDYSALLRRAIGNNYAAYPDSLLAKLLSVRTDFPDVKTDDYNWHIHHILYELIGAMILLVGISFAKILSQLFKKNEHDAGDLNFDQFVGFLADEALAPVCIDEALRLNPTTTMLRRRVVNRAEIAGAVLNPEDEIFLLLNGACTDERAFPNPHVFNPEADRRYLNFGPIGGVHQCYGQHWARAILREMFLTLSTLPNVAPIDGDMGRLQTFQQIPDQMLIRYAFPGEDPHRKASLLTA